MKKPLMKIDDEVVKSWLMVEVRGLPLTTGEDLKSISLPPQEGGHFATATVQALPRNFLCRSEVTRIVRRQRSIDDCSFDGLPV